MNKTISAMEARKRFGEILNRVSLLNEEIVIKRAGKPVARLCPVEPRQQTHRAQGKLDFRKAAGLGREIWEGIDVDQYIKRERE